jgi:hypothetical protein
MSKPVHLTSQLLVRSLDGELSEAEQAIVAGHIAGCEVCARELENLLQMGAAVTELVAAAPLAVRPEDRSTLTAKLEAHAKSGGAAQTPEKVLRRFGWGMAIAASLALGIMLTPHRRVAVEQKQSGVVAVASNAIEVGGESFIALPYSNPDMPVNTSRIVQMQVPVSSLTEMGIALEPVANQVAGQDRSVLADVLVGSDGQPLGVHVVSFE